MQARREQDNHQRREGSPGCGCLFILLIGVGIAAFFAIARDADFPGAETLRTAGREGEELYQQVRQLLGADSAIGENPQEPLSAPTPTPSSEPPSSTRQAVTPEATAAVTPSPQLASTPLPPSSTRQAVTPEATAAATPSPQLASTPLPPPARRHYEYKAYMLELINEERTKAGVPPVTLGDNIAAQLHAEAGLENCTGSHWGIDGLKPYMRYSLAGGYHANGENWLGSDYCIKALDFYRALGSIKTEVREGMEGWMNSPGHRRSILNKWHRKVNIGLAWDKYNFRAVQHFEGDYVEYDRLPEIANGTLSLSGRGTNGLRFSGKGELGLQMYYDPPPHPLTRGQVSRTYCYSSGLLIAGFRYPLTGRSFWAEDEFTIAYSSCPDPYDVPPDSPPPQSPREAREFWKQAYEASRDQAEQAITAPWLTATKWEVRDANFSVTANVSGLLAEHGAGVYTVLLWGEMGGEKVPVSRYSIFHEVTPPDTYNPHRWK